MKKICFTMVAGAAMLFSAQTVSAQEVPENTKAEQEAVVVQETSDWRSIETSELPAEVQEALERDYAGAVISEAFIQEKEGAKEYKLVVQTVDGQEKTLYSDASGNWIEHKDQEQK